MFEVVSATRGTFWIDATVRATAPVSLERFLARVDPLNRRIVETWAFEVEAGETFRVRLPRVERTGTGEMLPPDAVIFQSAFAHCWTATRTTGTTHVMPHVALAGVQAVAGSRRRQAVL